MIDKAKPKGLRPLSLSHSTTPLAALLPVTGTGNRIYRAEEATAPAEAQTLLLLSPAAQSSPDVVLAPQAVPVILLLDLIPDSTDKPAAEPQSPGLPGGGGYCRPAPGAAYGPSPCSNNQPP